jgi:hypothetical protein
VRVELSGTVEAGHAVILELCVVMERMQAGLDELKARLNRHSQRLHQPPSGGVAANVLRGRRQFPRIRRQSRKMRNMSQ